MLIYTARVAALALHHKRLGRIGLLDAVVQSARAWPWHCDNNRHINNARYLLFMDYGRTAWIARLGLVDAIVQQRLHFLVGGTHLIFRRSVDLLEPFTLETRLVAWDERWFFIEQTFRRQDGQTAVRGLVRGMARDPAGLVPPERLLGLTGRAPGTSPPMPEEFQRWIATCDAGIARIRASDVA